MQNARTEIELCVNILALRCDKTTVYKIEIFCSKVLQSNFFKTLHVLELLHLQNPFFSVMQMGQKMPKGITELKTKERYENSTIKLVLKRCETFAENYFINLIWRSKHNSHLAKRTFYL